MMGKAGIGVATLVLERRACAYWLVGSCAGLRASPFFLVCFSGGVGGVVSYLTFAPAPPFTVRLRIAPAARLPVCVGRAACLPVLRAILVPAPARGACRCASIFLLRLFFCRAPGAGSAGQRSVCVTPPRSPDIAVWRGRAFMSLVVSDATPIIHSCAELRDENSDSTSGREIRRDSGATVARSWAVWLELSHVVLEPCVGRLVQLHSLKARGSQNGVWPWGCGVRSLWRSLQFGYPPLPCALALSALESADRSVCFRVLPTSESCRYTCHPHLRRILLCAPCPNAQVPSGQGYLSSLPAGLKRLSDLLPTGESSEHGTYGSQALIRAGLCACSHGVSSCLWACQGCNN